jgi:hypothetical protein
MDEFMQKHAPHVNGSLSGFDRLVFRGTLRSLAVKSGMLDYLSRAGLLLKDFGGFVEQKSQPLKQASLAEAQRSGRPVQYLSSPKLSKEELARSIAGVDGITAGLICVLMVVEVCMSFEIFRDRQAKKLSLEPRTRALRPWSEPDRLLLEAISRGEFAVHGFRNRDLRQARYPGRCLPDVQRRLSSLLADQLSPSALARARHDPQGATRETIPADEKRARNDDGDSSCATYSHLKTYGTRRMIIMTKIHDSGG